MITKSRLPEAHGALHVLLSEAFTSDEFKREVLGAIARRDPRLVCSDLLPPSENTPLAAYFDRAIELFERQNSIPLLFEAVLRARTYRADQIVDVGQLWGLDLRERAKRACAGATAAPALPVNATAGEKARRAAVDRLEQLSLMADSPSYEEMRERKSEKNRLAQEIKQDLQPKAGDVVAGTVLEKMLDCGTFGQVWLSHVEGDPTQRRATKIFFLDLLGQGRRLHHFRRGCLAMYVLQLVRSKSRPAAIVQSYEVSADTLAFSMEYLPGGNLASVPLQTWSLDDKLRAFRRICEAIAFVHRLGIIHRDICPNNIVLDEHGDPVVTDLDIADAEFFADGKLSFSAGTRLYASPEQLGGKARGEPVDDVYSLARLLHFMLLGEDPPMSADPAYEASLARLPAALAAVIRRATGPAVEDRYHTADALRMAVDQAHAAQTERIARPASPVQRWNVPTNLQCLMSPWVGASLPNLMPPWLSSPTSPIAAASASTEVGHARTGGEAAPAATASLSAIPVARVVRTPVTGRANGRRSRRAIGFSLLLMSMVALAFFVTVKALGDEDGSSMVEAGAAAEDTGPTQVASPEHVEVPVDSGEDMASTVEGPWPPVANDGDPEPGPVGRGKESVPKTPKRRARDGTADSGKHEPPRIVEPEPDKKITLPPSPPIVIEPDTAAYQALTLDSARESTRDVATKLDACRVRLDPQLMDATFSFLESDDGESMFLALEPDLSSHRLARTTACVGNVMREMKFNYRAPDESLPRRRFRLHLGTCVSRDGKCDWRIESEYHGNGH
jgi:serine/threonine protein kinase